jgi:hypothetical protein
MGVNLICLSEDSDQWRNQLNMLMNCRLGSTKLGEFLNQLNDY